MDIPLTEDEAKAHIMQVRRTKGLDGPEMNTSDLESALIILSEQLYQRSTRFLSELIQNADDNSYDTPTPTLNITFTYDNRTLRIDCNEAGFGKSNVEAICKIGRSTKVAMGEKTRYIGEKGIGFKSVFKVSDIVWITSGHYSFKFDKSQKLGMIAPIWCAFPDFPLAGNTSILLQLSANYDTSELVDELKSLDTKQLLFLRKLRQINVTSYGQLGKVWRRTLERQDAPSSSDGVSIIRLHHDAAFSSFRIIRFPVQRMPSDPKRLGCVASEILLAFPTWPDGHAYIETQKVYAFLPVRDYGFKFLLQADFLLTASREDIDASSPWNRRLLIAIPDAFLLAVQTFNKGDFRYWWIRYLEERPPLSDFFEHLESAIRRSLSRVEVLESLAGSFARPPKLRAVPKEFSDEQGMPLIQTNYTKSKYLSLGYALNFQYPSALFGLGVQPLSTEEFLRDLRAFVYDDSASFQGMSNAWHSSLSKALIHIIHGNPAIKDTAVCSLPIIPLRDGRWVAPSEQQTCFSMEKEKLGIPGGIMIGEIDLRAVFETSRRDLFLLLGARVYNKDMVCDAITRMHETTINPEKLKAHDLISHAAFLFNAGWRNPGHHDLWVATEDGTAKRASQTYTNSSQAYSAKVLFGEMVHRFPFLHIDYSNATWMRYGSGMTWMQEHLYVAEYPRLISSLWPNLQLAMDFRLLTEEIDSLQLLLLLRDRWKDYSNWFIPVSQSILDSQAETSRARLREKIASITVPCRGGSKHPLGKTILPMTDLVSNGMDPTTFLQVPNPEDRRWRFLRHFGVIVDPGVKQFIQYLRQMKNSGATRNRVSEMYRHIDAYATQHIEEIRNAFEVEDLIYIPSSNAHDHGDWVRTSICVWNGPKWLRKTPCLQDFYPEHYAFFWQTLGFRDATWKTIVEEAQCMNASDDVEYISEVFMAINNSLEEARSPEVTNEIIKALKDAYIFPIDGGKSHSAFDYLAQVKEFDMWFIADRWHLWKSFKGLVPLLAVTVDVIAKIQPTIKKLGLTDRLLSQIAGPITKAGGSIEPHAMFTTSLRAKARHIARCVYAAAEQRRNRYDLANNETRILPSDHSARKEVITQLCNLLVYTSEEVVVQWSIKVHQQEIVGRADSGRVKITYKGKTMNIYLRKKDADAVYAPLELREHIGKLCELEEAAQIRLLDFILAEFDMEEIDDELSRRGFPKSVPEYDEVFHSLNVADPLNLFKSDPSEPVYNDQRRFYGRRLNTRRRQAQSLDPVQLFLQKFNMANTFQNQLAKPWSEAEADHMLSHLCRLDNVDPWALLPQNRGPWNDILKSTSQAPGNVTGIHWNNSRHIHHKAHLTKTTNSFPATVFQDSQNNLRIDVSTAVQNMVDDEMLFAAELQVSRLFETHLEGAYIPELHWTSPLRSKLGLLPFTGADATTSSTFTIRDSNGAFTNLLVRNGYKKAASWRAYPTYHIEVSPCEGDVSTKFCLDPHQVQKAWDCFIGMKTGPIEVFVLLRIIHTRSDPQIVLFVDPWQLHADGILNLTSTSQYEASFRSDLQGIVLDSPEDVMQCSKDQEKSFGNLFHRKRSSRNRLSLHQNDIAYTYDRLQFGEMRLLELFPGDESTPLSGKVFHTIADKSQPFVALSYAWGPAMKPFRLRFPQGHIPITSSLHSALKRLRKSKESVIIWVDAVCINQQDNHEKAIQIRMLPRIFHSAGLVVAWIGDEKDDSSQAMQTLLQIRTLDIAPIEWPHSLPEPPYDWNNGVPPSDDHTWWSIRNLLKREWFSRVWVIQEVVLAYDIRITCGDWEMGWDDFVRAVGICLDQDADLLGPDSYLRQILPVLKPAYTLGLTRSTFKDKKLSKRFELLSLLDIFAYAKSTKECDKLFALLGLASDAGEPAFDPDYASPLESVVRRYTEEFVKRGNAMDLLYRAGMAKAYAFSSWIPRWTGEVSGTISTWRGSAGVFRAAASTLPQTYICAQDPNLLLAMGMWVDTIVKASAFSLRDRDIITVVNDAHAYIDELDEYPTSESLSAVKLKVPIGNAVAPCADDMILLENITSNHYGRASNRKEVEHAFNWDESFTAVHCMRDMVSVAEQPKDRRERSWKYWTTAAAFMKRLSDGRFVITNKGYVGIAPYDAKVGDRIYVLNGGAVPFVVRKTSHVGKGNMRADTLVGEAYIHGIMYGEAMSFQGIRKEQVVLV